MSSIGTNSYNNINDYSFKSNSSTKEHIKTGINLLDVVKNIFNILAFIFSGFTFFRSFVLKHILFIIACIYFVYMLSRTIIDYYNNEIEKKDVFLHLETNFLSLLNLFAAVI